ncbi:lymphotoxin-alpha-like [Nerophis lumbriciformis]|uniref:lymphotoxin-alpha-like n=1 Tax=Nerophis lumbriciformis TaxID=546530 RepID=UPI002ADF86C5|nr:lymphotoxin-alpha-like [Nerophis lumbriciformis]
MESLSGSCWRESRRSSMEDNTSLHNTSFKSWRKTLPRARVGCALVFLAVFLLSSAGVLLVALALRGADPSSPDTQSAKHDGRRSPDHSRQQQKNEDKNPSALLTAPEGNRTDGQYLRWGTEHHNAHLHGGFSYSDGSLVVPRTGLYRVFLQVTYWIPDDFKYDTCPLRLENIVYIFRTSYKEDMPLLSTKHTLSCSTKNWYETVYTAASFELDAQSKLRVTSTLKHLISADATSVFFGAELLP